MKSGAVLVFKSHEIGTYGKVHVFTLLGENNFIWTQCLLLWLDISLRKKS